MAKSHFVIASYTLPTLSENGQSHQIRSRITLYTSLDDILEFSVSDKP